MIGEHNLIDRVAVTTGGMVLWWHNPQQDGGAGDYNRAAISAADSL